MADLAQEELLRVADEDAEVDVVPELAEIDISSDDEIGGRPQAFNLVQTRGDNRSTTPGRQPAHVGSMSPVSDGTTTNLVGRQLS